MDATNWTRTAAMCLGKATFSTPQLAKKVQRRRTKTKTHGAPKQEVYRCKVCNLYHIGTRSKPRHTTKSGVRRFRVHEIEDDLSMA